MSKSGTGWHRFAIIVVFLSIAFAYALFLYGRQGLFFDAFRYTQLGEQIATRGLFRFADDTRTFGYPLFIAIFWNLSGHLPSTFLFLVFNAQLLIFLGACLIGFQVFNRLTKRLDLASFLFALLVLNPFLLIYTGVALSDLLSAVLDLVALLLAVQPPPEHTSVEGIRKKGLDRTLVFTFLSFLAAGGAAMVRPANVVIGLAVAAVWLLRRVIFKEGSVWSGLAAVSGFLVPFIPQLVNNYTAFGQLQPLIVRSLYGEQLQWGMQYLKYATVILPGNASGIASGITYKNPFWSPEIGSLSDFISKRPPEFFLTQGIHLFALFDHDYAFPYITNLDAWYRLPLGILNYVFLFAAIVGIGLWAPRALHPTSFSRLDLALAGMLIGVLVYVPEYVLTAAEPRFSLPLYLWLAPFVVYACSQISTWPVRAQWRRTTLLALGLIFFLVMNLALYYWLLSLAPFLDVRANGPTNLDRYSMDLVHARIGDRLELTNVGVDRTRPVRGGDTIYLALEWLCKGAPAESYEVQIKVVDSGGRIWSRLSQDPNAKWSPCLNRLWIPSRATDLVALNLPVVMPAGEYNVLLSLYDRASNHYATVYRASADPSGESLQLARLAILKNTSSIAANQLSIENPFFVDMQEMRLLGFAPLPDEARSGDELDVGLYWRARGKPRGDYVVVIQLRDSPGKVVIEQSARPAEDTYATTGWNEGEVLLDWHRIALPPGLAEGEYQLVAILREIGTNRLLGESQFAKIHLGR